jgi:hypothetical protein
LPGFGQIGPRNELVPMGLEHTHTSRVLIPVIPTLQILSTRKRSVTSTSATVNGVLKDSVVEQINKAIQEAGIDLKIEAGKSFEVSPEGAVRCIADFENG